MHVLVVNCGSTTLKWKLFHFAGDGDHPDGRPVVLAAANVAVANAGPANASSTNPTATNLADGGGFRDAVQCAVGTLPVRPDVVAHRVVHGGEVDADLMVIDDAVLRTLRELTAVAPLHNAPALAGIDATLGLGVPLVAAFDSAFHRTMPEVARRYALPELPGVRRYGFHGWSHRSVTERYAELAGSPEPTIITLHLGGGCSAAAIRRGRSVDTSMGYSPLEGLVMGTRAGDLDSGVLLHLLRDGMPFDRLERLLNHEAGLQGVAGTHDLPALLRRTDPAAELAIELFCYRVRKYIGAYLSVLEGAEAIVFTGGIGEHAPEIRERISRHLGWAGLTLDAARNRDGHERISTDGSTLAAYTLPAAEEGLIAREVVRLLTRSRRYP